MRALTECLQSGWKILPVAQCVAGGFAHLPHAGWCAVWYRFLATLYNVRASREMATAVREGGARAAVRLSGPRPPPPFPRASGARAHHDASLGHTLQWAICRRSALATTRLRSHTMRAHLYEQARRDELMRAARANARDKTRASQEQRSPHTWRRAVPADDLRGDTCGSRVSIPRLPIARATLSPCTCPSPPRTGLSSRRRCM